MSRSARGGLTGYNIQKPSGERVSDLGNRVLLLYDESAAFAPEVRQRVPDALIVLRLLQNSHWGDPEGTARAGAGLVAAYPMIDVVCPANEQNHENGASSGAIAAWCERFRDEWQRQGRPRPLVTPALSTGAPFDLAALRDAWAGWDYIGVHGYTNWDDLTFGMALSNIDAHRRMWPDQPQLLTEFNVDKAEEQSWRWGELAGAVDSFLGRLADLGYVKGAMWFLDDSWIDGQWPYRLCRIPELMNLYRSIGHEQGNGPGPVPPDPPADPDIAAIEDTYNIYHVNSDTMVLAELVPRPDPANITADAPEGAVCRVSTKDNAHQTEWARHVDMPFTHPAAYYPEQGQSGFYYAECEGARVDGLGWALGVPGDTAPHRNVAVRFSRRSTPPQPPSGYVWDGAFGPYAASHPEVGQPVGPNSYLPQATEPWPVCAQLSATHVLCWTGNSVHALRRD